MDSTAKRSVRNPNISFVVEFLVLTDRHEKCRIRAKNVSDGSLESFMKNCAPFTEDFSGVVDKNELSFDFAGPPGIA